MGGRFLLSGAGLPKNMYKSRKSVLLELLNIEICAILYNVYPKRKGNLTLLHYDAILFDVDGTLIDSAPGILNTLEEVFSSMGVDVARSDLGRYIGPPLRKSFGEHFSDPAKIEEATKRYRVSYAAKGCHEGGVYPGVVEMLGRLKAAGLTLCTATCKPTKSRTLRLTSPSWAARPWMRAATTRPTSSATSSPSPSCRASGC